MVLRFFNDRDLILASNLLSIPFLRSSPDLFSDSKGEFLDKTLLSTPDLLPPLSCKNKCSIIHFECFSSRISRGNINHSIIKIGLTIFNHVSSAIFPGSPHKVFWTYKLFSSILSRTLFMFLYSVRSNILFQNKRKKNKPNYYQDKYQYRVKHTPSISVIIDWLFYLYY